MKNRIIPAAVTGTPWKNRPELEYDVLSAASKAGVSVPKPVAHIHRETLIYRGWLVTRMVANHRSLASIDANDEASLAPITAQVVRSVLRLIDVRICHPGNVLVGGDGRIYLIDFVRSNR